MAYFSISILGWIKNIFDLSPPEIKLEDIKQFFGAYPHESQHLEFKSGDVDLSKIQKEVCAFLNSDGGLLILGAPREGDQSAMLVLNHFPDSETLFQQITSGIVPQPSGIKVLQIPGEDGSVFLIDIPESNITPHQMHGSGTYYMRQEAVSRPAMHEEVERMFMEKRKAVLDLQIEIERPDDALQIRLIVGNKSSISAYEPGFNFVCTPVRFQPENNFQLQSIANENYLAEGQQWLQKIEVYPSESRFFIHCQYYCRDVAPKTKAAFAEIINNKVELLSIFNSEMHPDYNHWYEENLYLLND